MKRAVRIFNKFSVFMFFIILICFIVVFSKKYNPLPTDEEMVAYFYDNRDSLEDVVDYYRSDKSLQSKEWFELIKKAGVGGVDSIGLWYADPYSAESRDYIVALLKMPLSSRLTVEQKYPQRIYGGLSISLENEKYHSWVFGMQKEFYHTPVSPRVSEGFLWFPLDLKGSSKGYRILKSLDGVPDQWEDGECLYRKVERHWFIRMCRLLI